MSASIFDLTDEQYFAWEREQEDWTPGQDDEAFINNVNNNFHVNSTVNFFEAPEGFWDDRQG